jgi:hypothetical protein
MKILNGEKFIYNLLRLIMFLGWSGQYFFKQIEVFQPISDSVLALTSDSVAAECQQ